MIKRKSFAKLKEVFNIPNLLDVQLEAYREFLQVDSTVSNRKHQGLQEVFTEIFPIESANRAVKLEFISYSLGKSKYNIAECKTRSLTYALPLKVKFRLTTPKEAKEQDAYFGDIPLMTDTGTFIINGDERVVVSQLQRSPGVSFEEELHPTGKKIFHGRIIPYRGAWLEFKYDLTETIIAYVDRRRNFPATQILRILGFSEDKDILAAFGKEYPEIVNTLKKDYTKNKEEAYMDFYRKMRPTEPVTKEAAEALFYRLFFDPARYDLERAGRFILNRKLGMDVSLEKRILDSDTVVKVLDYLINLKAGVGKIDDIDHLGNRRIKTVGELVQNQLRIGLSRVERSIRERLSILSEFDNVNVHYLINSKLLSNQIRDFFSRSQLSQFMDQINPLAEMTHKRRLSALGPGGLSRERAGFEVRDIHPSHYGRVCPIETPEGPNIGLIASLSTFARINTLGLLETPYRKVEDGKVSKRVEYLTADIEEDKIIAQANVPLNEDGTFVEKEVSCRYKNDFPKVSAKQVQYMDVSPKQLVSVAASLIPFLEHDDANRALMGSNMQRQGVPLMITEPALVSTQMEEKVARDSGTVVVAEESGKVTSIDAASITIGKKIYHLKKFLRTNNDTCLNQRPIVKLGDRVEQGDAIADGIATKGGELALGKNVLVSFMPWRGYNFEDSILISERLLKEDTYTSLHIEVFETVARDTKLGKEEITRDIPNVGEDALRNLDESGIVRIGAVVKAGDTLVGKVTPKGETQLSPEEKLLRAIFGEKAGDVKDTSLRVPPGIEGVVIDAKVFSRKGVEKDDRSLAIEELEIVRLENDMHDELNCLENGVVKTLADILEGKKVSSDVVTKKSEIIIPKGSAVTHNSLLQLRLNAIRKISFLDQTSLKDEVDLIFGRYDNQSKEIRKRYEARIERLRKGDDLAPGVIKMVKIYVVKKRKLSVGDKMAGRHGNKGVVSRILPEEDMPYFADGRPVDIVLNPLGVPSRMNVGQVLEAHLGLAARKLGEQLYDLGMQNELKLVKEKLKKIYSKAEYKQLTDGMSDQELLDMTREMKNGLHMATPVFDGAMESEIRSLLVESGMSEVGQSFLYDGLTGERFENPITVGTMYIVKLHHLVDDKIHARSTGPYSLVTQQPLGGKAQFGGQRLGEMEVWAMEAYGAAYTLQEFLTVKSDDVGGRTKMYEKIVKGNNFLEAGLPESFYVLVKELQGLCLDMELIDE